MQQQQQQQLQYTSHQQQQQQQPQAKTLDEVEEVEEEEVGPKRPSNTARFGLLLGRFVKFYWREKGLYFLRCVTMLLLGLYTGTVFWKVPHDLSHLMEISGALFYSLWVCLFAATLGITVFTRDLSVFDTEYLNGALGDGLIPYCLASFLASLPYHLTINLAFTLSSWFSVGFHASSDTASEMLVAWIYTTLSLMSIGVFVESTSLAIAHTIKDAMLSTTFAIVSLGTLGLFPGFFVKTDDMVRSLFWASYIVPTRYVLNGQLVNTFSGQAYQTGYPAPFDAITGDEILNQFFSLNSSESKWVNLAIAWAFALYARFAVFLSLRFAYRSYEQKTVAESDVAATKDE